MTELMQGITILNQTEIMKAPTWAENMMLAGIVVLAIGFIVGVSAISINHEKVGIISLIIAIIGVLVSLAGTICLLSIDEPTGKYKYDCLISEDVSMTEFYEKYEVLEVNGQIWKIKEK